MKVTISPYPSHLKRYMTIFTGCSDIATLYTDAINSIHPGLFTELFAKEETEGMLLLPLSLFPPSVYQRWKTPILLLAQLMYEQKAHYGVFFSVADAARVINRLSPLRYDIIARQATDRFLPMSETTTDDELIHQLRWLYHITALEKGSAYYDSHPFTVPDKTVLDEIRRCIMTCHAFLSKCRTLSFNLPVRERYHGLTYRSHVPVYTPWVLWDVTCSDDSDMTDALAKLFVKYRILKAQGCRDVKNINALGVFNIRTGTQTTIRFTELKKRKLLAVINDFILSQSKMVNEKKIDCLHRERPRTASGFARVVTDELGYLFEGIDLRRYPLSDSAHRQSKNGMTIGHVALGLVVDYLTRFMMGDTARDAFLISLVGAARVTSKHIKVGGKKASEYAAKLAQGITGLDDVSIKNAVKLVHFDTATRAGVDVWAKTRSELLLPDDFTFHLIRNLVVTSILFFEDRRDEHYRSHIVFPGAHWGAIYAGDGDYLTKGYFWDMKVSNMWPVVYDLVQLMTYYMLSTQCDDIRMVKNIEKLGIVNPLLGECWEIDVNDDSIKLLFDILYRCNYGNGVYQRTFICGPLCAMLEKGSKMSTYKPDTSRFYESILNYRHQRYINGLCLFLIGLLKGGDVSLLDAFTINVGGAPELEILKRVIAHHVKRQQITEDLVRSVHQLFRTCHLFNRCSSQSYPISEKMIKTITTLVKHTVSWLNRIAPVGTVTVVNSYGEMKQGGATHLSVETPHDIILFGTADKEGISYSGLSGYDYIDYKNKNVIITSLYTGVVWKYA